jgi:L-seryl-tRNA(Ser) seleniumtransferase
VCVLVGAAVFKTDEAENLGLAGSIPVRLRHPTLPRRALSESYRSLMTAQPPPGELRRRIPRTDELLRDPQLRAAATRLGRLSVKSAVTDAQEQARRGEIAPDSVLAVALAGLPATAGGQRRVLNATGVLLHTNLGRAALSDAAVAAVVSAAGTTDVEFDLTTGRRARRGRSALAALAAAVPAAEAVHVVNNGAAALVLAATTLAQGREIIISRGELVEIGDGFRIPDLVASTGARLREVGTTNRTSLADYTAAIRPDTGMLLKIHPSNFVIRGFTASVPVADLADLGVPLVVDIGSGLLTRQPLLPEEPDATTALRAGAALVTGSGDKLLGGPQIGLLLGRQHVVERLRRHPLARALRVDKLTLAALEATLQGPPTPTEQALTVSAEFLQARAETLAHALTEAGVDARAVSSTASVGGGGAPEQPLPSAAISLPERYAAKLRAGSTAVVGRLESGRCLLDLRAIPAANDDGLRQAILAATDISSPRAGST